MFLLSFGSLFFLALAGEILPTFQAKKLDENQRKIVQASDTQVFKRETSKINEIFEKK